MVDLGGEISSVVEQVQVGWDARLSQLGHHKWATRSGVATPSSSIDERVQHLVVLGEGVDDRCHHDIVFGDFPYPVFPSVGYPQDQIKPAQALDGSIGVHKILQRDCPTPLELPQLCRRCNPMTLVQHESS